MSHPVILTLLGYFLFSAAVGAMLPPTPEQARTVYGWLYRFLQRLAANADRLAEAKLHLEPAVTLPLQASAEGGWTADEWTLLAEHHASSGHDHNPGTGG